MPTTPPRRSGFGSRIGLPDALRGIRVAWTTSRNLRIEGVIALLALSASLLLSVSPTPILTCIALVMSLEIVNSAIERSLDLSSPDTHPLARDAKDMAAGAVLLAALLSVAVGLTHLGPPLWTVLTKG